MKTKIKSFLKRHIILVVAILVFIISYFLYGFPSILFFIDSPLAGLFVFLENLTNCGDYCFDLEIIVASLANTAIASIILYYIIKKKNE